MKCINFTILQPSTISIAKNTSILADYMSTILNNLLKQKNFSQQEKWSQQNNLLIALPGAKEHTTVICLEMKEK